MTRHAQATALTDRCLRRDAGGSWDWCAEQVSRGERGAIPAGADAPHLCTCSFPGLLALDTSTLVSGALSGPQRAHAGSPVCVQASRASTAILYV